MSLRYKFLLLILKSERIRRETSINPKIYSTATPLNPLLLTALIKMHHPFWPYTHTFFNFLIIPFFYLYLHKLHC